MQIQLASALILTSILLKANPSRILFTHGWLKYGKHGRHEHTNLTCLSPATVPPHPRLSVHTKSLRVLHAGAVVDLPALQTLSLAHCGVETLEAGAFANLPRLAHLRLHDNRLQAIPKGVFAHLPVRTLSLQRNRIETIAPDALNAMLVTVKLNSNRLHEWDPRWFGSALGSLGEVYARRNRIGRLPEGAFAGLGGGAKVFLSRNRLGPRFAPGAFDGVQRLSQLWLDRNRIELLDDYTFRDLRQIDVIYLARNRIGAVGEEAFGGLRTVGIFDISSNALKCLPERIIRVTNLTNVEANPLTCNCTDGFKRVRNERASFSLIYTNHKHVANKPYTNLTQIDHHTFANVVTMKLSKTQLPIITNGFIKNLAHLEHLALPRLRIQHLQPHCFRNLPRIATIHLQNNEIQRIEAGVFNYLPIKSLFLQRNQIRTIRSNAFDHLPNLTEIHLNKNRIREWDPRWFLDTPSLAEIYFRRNQIAEIPAKAFANLKSSHRGQGGDELVDLKICLSKNRIGRVHPGAFDGLDALYELWLDRNRIEGFEPLTFAGLTRLDRLYLMKNRLREVGKGWFPRVGEMGVLQVAGNRVECVPYEVVVMAEAVFVGGGVFDCDCLVNLRSRLREDGVIHRIYGGDGECGLPVQ